MPLLWTLARQGKGKNVTGITYSAIIPHSQVSIWNPKYCQGYNPARCFNNTGQMLVTKGALLLREHLFYMKRCFASCSFCFVSDVSQLIVQSTTTQQVLRAATETDAAIYHTRISETNGLRTTGVPADRHGKPVDLMKVTTAEPSSAEPS